MFSDQHEISPYDVNEQSSIQVMRIEEMITKDQMQIIFKQIQRACMQPARADAFFERERIPISPARKSLILQFILMSNAAK